MRNRLQTAVLVFSALAALTLSVSSVLGATQDASAHQYGIGPLPPPDIEPEPGIGPLPPPDIEPEPGIGPLPPPDIEPEG